MSNKEEKLAIQSWKDTLKFYAFISRETGDDFSQILKVIEYIEKNGLNRILHASTSHTLLNISTHHRWDAKVDCLRISKVENNLIMFEYFKLREELVSVEYANEEDILKFLKKYLAQLMKKLKTVAIH